jgi:hypothetical protein
MTSPHPLLPPDRVRYVHKRRALVFTQNGLVARGILPLLRSSFYRHYEKKNAIQGPVPDAKETAAKKAKKGKGKAKSKGKAYGRLIDRQLIRGCKVINKYALDIVTLLAADSMTIRSLKNGKVIHRSVQAFRKSAEPATRNLLATMNKMHLHPIATQYGVASHSQRVGTLVDVVCRSTLPGQEREIVPIEIKTGCIDGAKHTGVTLATPFTGYSDSMFSQFHLQLAANVILLNTTLQDHITRGIVEPVTKGYVMRASAGMVKVMPLEQNIMRRSDAIRNAFSRSKH